MGLTNCGRSYPERVWLRAVPFWIVERSREIAEREKKKKNKNESERGEGGLGRGASSRLFLLAPVSLLAVFK